MDIDVKIDDNMKTFLFFDMIHDFSPNKSLITGDFNKDIQLFESMFSSVFGDIRGITKFNQDNKGKSSTKYIEEMHKYSYDKCKEKDRYFWGNPIAFNNDVMLNRFNTLEEAVDYSGIMGSDNKDMAVLQTGTFYGTSKPIDIYGSLVIKKVVSYDTSSNDIPIEDKKKYSRGEYTKEESFTVKRPIYIIEDAIMGKNQIGPIFTQSYETVKRRGDIDANIISLKTIPGVYDPANRKLIRDNLTVLQNPLGISEKCNDNLSKSITFNFQDVSNNNNNFFKSKIINDNFKNDDIGLTIELLSTICNFIKMETSRFEYVFNNVIAVSDKKIRIKLELFRDPSGNLLRDPSGNLVRDPSGNLVRNDLSPDFFTFKNMIIEFYENYKKLKIIFDQKNEIINKKINDKKEIENEIVDNNIKQKITTAEVWIKKYKKEGKKNEENNLKKREMYLETTLESKKKEEENVKINIKEIKDMKKWITQYKKPGKKNEEDNKKLQYSETYVEKMDTLKKINEELNKTEYLKNIDDKETIYKSNCIKAFIFKKCITLLFDQSSSVIGQWVIGQWIYKNKNKKDSTKKLIEIIKKIQYFPYRFDKVLTSINELDGIVITKNDSSSEEQSGATNNNTSLGKVIVDLNKNYYGEDKIAFEIKKINDSTDFDKYITETVKEKIIFKIDSFSDWYKNNTPLEKEEIEQLKEISRKTYANYLTATNNGENPDDDYYKLPNKITQEIKAVMIEDIVIDLQNALLIKLLLNFQLFNLDLKVDLGVDEPQELFAEKYDNINKYVDVKIYDINSILDNLNITYENTDIYKNKLNIEFNKGDINYSLGNKNSVVDVVNEFKKKIKNIIREDEKSDKQKVNIGSEGGTKKQNLESVKEIITIFPEVVTALVGGDDDDEYEDNDDDNKDDNKDDNNVDDDDDRKKRNIKMTLEESRYIQELVKKLEGKDDKEKYYIELFFIFFKKTLGDFSQIIITKYLNEEDPDCKYNKVSQVFWTISFDIMMSHIALYYGANIIKQGISEGDEGLGYVSYGFANNKVFKTVLDNDEYNKKDSNDFKDNDVQISLIKVLEQKNKDFLYPPSYNGGEKYKNQRKYKNTVKKKNKYTKRETIKKSISKRKVKTKKIKKRRKNNKTKQKNKYTRYI